MRKEVVVKDDGRQLILYHFTTEGEATSGPPHDAPTAHDQGEETP